MTLIKSKFAEVSERSCFRLRSSIHEEEFGRLVVKLLRALDSAKSKAKHENRGEHLKYSNSIFVHFLIVHRGDAIELDQKYAFECVKNHDSKSTKREHDWYDQPKCKAH